MDKIILVLEATIGGTRKHIFDLAAGFSLDGFDVHLFYSDKRADDKWAFDREKLKCLGVKLHYLPMEKAIFSFKNISCAYQFNKFIRKHDIQEIHLHGAIAGGVGRLAGMFSKKLKHIYYTPHGGAFHKMKSFKGRIFKFIERVLNGKRVTYIAVSNNQKSDIINMLGLDSSRIITVPNGIDVDIDIPENKKEPNNLLSVLYPAVFLEAKGHIPFFEAILNSDLKLNENVKFLLAGDGPLLSEAKRLIDSSDLDKQITFLGFRNDLSEFYNSCDIIILPSKDEAFGYVILEAFLYKKPVLAMNVGGIKEIVEHGVDGYLFNWDEIDLFIEKLNDLILDKEKILELGENGFSKVKRTYSIKEMLNKYKKIYLNTN